MTTPLQNTRYQDIKTEAALDPHIRKFLDGLRESELETLKALVALPADEVREMAHLARATKTVAKFTKWLIVTIVGTFVGITMLYENIIKVITWITQTK